VNRALKQGDSIEEARRAGAYLIMSAIDCDAVVVAARNTGRRDGGLPTVAINLSRPAKRREANKDGAGDRMVAAILRNEIPGKRSSS
jgi:hypothetical protein